MRNKEFISELDILFEQERDAIFDGTFEELQVIATKKNQMIKQVPTLKFSQAVVLDLMAKAKRNQELLAAVVRGVRMVNNRFNALRKNTGAIDTYDKSGNRIALKGNSCALEWRA